MRFVGAKITWRYLTTTIVLSTGVLQKNVSKIKSMENWYFSPLTPNSDLTRNLESNKHLINSEMDVFPEHIPFNLEIPTSNKLLLEMSS